MSVVNVNTVRLDDDSDLVDNRLPAGFDAQHVDCLLDIVWVRACCIDSIDLQYFLQVRARRVEDVLLRSARARELRNLYLSVLSDRLGLRHRNVFVINPWTHLLLLRGIHLLDVLDASDVGVFEVALELEQDLIGFGVAVVGFLSFFLSFIVAFVGEELNVDLS